MRSQAQRMREHRASCWLRLLVWEHWGHLPVQGSLRQDGMTTCFLGPTLAKSSVFPQLTHAHGLTEHLRAGRPSGHTDQWTHMQGRCPGITFSTLKVPSHSPGRAWALHMVSLDAPKMAGWFSALWEPSSWPTDMVQS